MNAEIFISHGETIYDPAICETCGQFLTDATTQPAQDSLTLDDYTADAGREADTFTHTQAHEITREYVCAVCYGELVVHPIDNSLEAMVVCPEHGSVSKTGRIMRSTVSIELERSARNYSQVVKNLADLWPELQTPKKTQAQILKELGY
jgi:DNA-directed RNA polymerase subunit RPC12/RpoP